MRLWVGGPRLFGLRTGVSFGREDFRSRRAASLGGGMTGGFVYVIRGQGAVKVGASTDPHCRIASLQTGNAYPLSFAFIGATECSPSRIEAVAHDILEEHRTQGEWFDVSPEFAMSAVMLAADRLGERIQSVPPDLVPQIIARANGAPAQAAGAVSGLSIGDKIAIAAPMVIAIIVSIASNTPANLGPVAKIEIGVVAWLLVVGAIKAFAWTAYRLFGRAVLTS